MSPEELAKVQKLISLLDEAYKHWDENTDDHHCKNADGAVSIHFGNYWNRRDGNAKISCEVYSYVLGPMRLHEFESIDEALEEVSKWHGEEMARKYDGTDEYP